MSEINETKASTEVNDGTSEPQEGKTGTEGLSRRTFLGVGSAGLATATLAALTAHAQDVKDTRQAEKDHSSSDPAQENKPLLDVNPTPTLLPPTDHGDIGPVWYSFDLVHKRVQEGGWTHEVNAKVLPSSTDLTGVNMRLTAGSFRELHWHPADSERQIRHANTRRNVISTDGAMCINNEPNA